MCQYFISLARVCCYKRFTIKSSMRGYLFQAISSFQWKCVRFQRTAAALDMPQHQIALLRLCVCVYLQINTGRHTSLCVWGETKCYISLYSQLFVLHSRSTWDSCEWVSGCKCIKICDITDCCFIFCWQKSSWGFVLYTDIWQVY